MEGVTGVAPEAILPDTSVLVDALSGPYRSAVALARLVESGHRLYLSSIVLYEWLRGPRQPRELKAQEMLFPEDRVLPFGPSEATRAAELYRVVRRPRGREMDLAIAACAIEWNAALWILNPGDFADIPGLRLWTPARR